MSQVIITEAALSGLSRCRNFLLDKAPEAAQRAAASIQKHFLLLETSPQIGRPFDEIPELRELLIPFGSSGYVALYRYDMNSNTVYILAFRHQKEAGY